MKRILDKYCT